MSDQEYDCQYKQETTCPYCGKEEGDSWELREDEGEIVCGYCGKTYLYERNIEVTYSSWKKESEAGDE